MLKYQVNEKAEKNEEEVEKKVVEEEVVGQDADTVYGNRKSQRT